MEITTDDYLMNIQVSKELRDCIIIDFIFDSDGNGNTNKISMYLTKSEFETIQTKFAEIHKKIFKD